MLTEIRARGRRVLPRAVPWRRWPSWQGPAGTACVTVAVGWLAAPAWALLTFGGFLLLAAATAAGEIEDGAG